MALRIKDRVKQGTTTTGAGTITLDVSFSSSGFQNFSVLGDGTQTYYAIEEGVNFEVGLGTYNSNTLTRSTILDSSNGGSAITLNGNANVFITYPADKAVFTDADNNATVTGLIVGQTGVKFNDGTIQTTAAVSFSAASGAKVDSNTANISLNDTDISNLSGLVSTNTSNISNNDTDISNLSGLVSTNTSNISSNDTDINTVSGLTVTNATNISNNSTDISTVSGLTVTNSNDIDTVSGLTVTNTNNISTNSTNIGTVSGLTVTNANNISTNSTDINTVSGIAVGKDNYQYWTITDGSNSENVQSTNSVKFTGEGNTTVSYDTGSNTVSISGSAAGGGGGYDFNVSAGGSSDTIASGETVTWTGLGSNTVTYNSSSNTFSISGTDQDLSSYATVSNLASTGATNAASAASNASNISTNTSNIASTGATNAAAAATNASNISTNTTNIASTGATNAAAAATNASNISTNTTNIASTGATNSAAAASNANDIDTVSGLLYSSWTASDGSNSEAISGGDQVKFTGTGATSVNYNTGTNTFTVNTPSSEAGYEGWTATDGSATSEIANGNDVKITGAGNVTVSFVSGTPNVFTVSGNDVSNTYTAGTGLQLVANEFNVSGIDSSMIVNGSVANADLANSSVTVTAGTGLSNGGSVSLGSPVTIDADTASTSQVGVVQLQDSATDGTTDKAITPNAVYDISGVLQTNIDGKDNYTKWVLQGDSATTTDIDSAETVQFTGVGNVSISLGGTDNRTVTISGNDVSNSYVAGSGLNEDPSKTFNVQTDNSTLEVNSDIVRIKDNGVTNAKLANTGVTVTAGTGLTNGGVVALGASVTVDAITASTSAAGVVQLQDTVTNGTTNRAVTPNAVYDMSGVINGNINTYTAGSGLNLDGTEFDVKLDNSTLEFNSDIIQIKDDGVTNAKLANTGVTVTAGTGLTNGGVVALGASVTVDAITASTSAAGVVQLQDSVTDSTTNKAVTPNAVYDMSGVLQTNIDNAGTTYTAGTGLILIGSTEFNVSGIDTTLLQGTITNAQLAGDIVNAKLVNDSVSYGGVSVDLGASDTTPAFNLTDATGYPTSSLVGTVTNAQLAGSIVNTKLVNDSVTVTAGSGLSNGGEVDLGASISVDITPGGVTAAMLNTDVTLDEITDHGATTTNNITMGTITTSGVKTPILSGAGGGSTTFDLSTGSTFTHTLAANSTTTLAVSNVTAGQKFVVRLEQNSGGTGLVNFFNGIRWAGGNTPPTLTATVSKIDVLGFITSSSGHYEGFIIGQNV